MYLKLAWEQQSPVPNDTPRRWLNIPTIIEVLISNFKGKIVTELTVDTSEEVFQELFKVWINKGSLYKVNVNSKDCESFIETFPIDDENYAALQNTQNNYQAISFPPLIQNLHDYI